MSLDLRLLPIDFDNGTYGFSHTVLSVDSGRLWHDLLEGIHLTDVPDSFNTYLAVGADGEKCYGDTQDTPYGEPLRAARVRDIVKALNAADLTTMGVRDLAAIAYLNALDPKTKVALYWQ